MEESKTTVWRELGNYVNKAQYFCPLFSWFIVSYTYFIIGRKGGPIWKYLFYVVSFGMLANVLSIIKEMSLGFSFHFNTFIYLNWIETILFGFNEWGFVYINYKKIKSCVKLLNNKVWTIFISIFLFYILFCRLFVTKYQFEEDMHKYKKDTNYEKKSQSFHAMIFIPIAFVEICMIICVMEQYFNKNNILNEELTILFHSTLSRTLMISLLYVFIGISVLIDDKKHFVECLKKVLWRIKGILGIIFLVDLLLLRIDLDNNNFKHLQNEIDKKQQELIRSSSLNYGSYSNSDYQKSNNIFLSSNKNKIINYPPVSPYAVYSDVNPSTTNYNDKIRSPHNSCVSYTAFNSATPLIHNYKYIEIK